MLIDAYQVLTLAKDGERHEQMLLEPPADDANVLAVETVQVRLREGCQVGRSGMGELLVYGWGYSYGCRLETAMTLGWAELVRDTGRRCA